MLDQQDQGFPRIQSMCPQHLVAWRPFAVEDQIHARRSDHMDSPRLFSPPLEAGGALSRGGEGGGGGAPDLVGGGATLRRRDAPAAGAWGGGEDRRRAGGA